MYLNLALSFGFIFTSIYYNFKQYNADKSMEGSHTWREHKTLFHITVNALQAYTVLSLLFKTFSLVIKPEDY